jgi:photosystem II stability/assembly factor-like uncharacterized protein
LWEAEGQKNRFFALFAHFCPFCFLLKMRTLMTRWRIPIFVSLFALAAFLLPLVSLSAISQQTAEGYEWVRQKTGSFTRFSTVFFVDRRRGWIAGSNGSLMVTEDGGWRWDRVPSLPEKQKNQMFRDLWAFKAKDNDKVSNLCLLGEYGSFNPRGDYNITDRTFIIFSRDQGENWSDGLLARQPWRRPDKATGRVTVDESGKAQPKEEDEYQEHLRTPEPVMVHMVFVDENVGWACGESGTIQRTKDGGANWNLQYVETKKLLYDVMAIDKSQAWVVGAGGTVLRTTNGGHIWEERPAGVTDALRSVYFVDAQRGWAVGSNGAIIATNDGGYSWQRQQSNTSEMLNDIFFVSPNAGWIAGNQGILLKTLDGGKTWEGMQVETHANLTRLFFIAPDCGWVVGTQGVIYKYDRR